MEVVRKILATALFITPGVVFADVAYENSDNGYIKQLVIRDNGIHSVFMHTDLLNLNDCSLSNRFVLDETAVGGKAMLATVMSASLSEVKIQARVGACQNIGADNDKTAPGAVSIKMSFELPVPPAPSDQDG